MSGSTLLLVALALGLVLYARSRGDGSHRRGIRMAWRTLQRTLPLLLAAFAIVGYLEVLAPQELVGAWIGPGSGWRGLLLGEAAGMVLPGGPYIVFPLIAALYESGAGLGPTLTMVTSWLTLALLSATFEVPFLGWRFTVVRFGLALAIPLLVGLAGATLLGG